MVIIALAGVIIGYPTYQSITNTEAKDNKAALLEVRQLSNDSQMNPSAVRTILKAEGFADEQINYAIRQTYGDAIRHK